MLEQLNRFFRAAHNLRRSNLALVRSGAAADLDRLHGEVYHPKLRARIAAALVEHMSRRAAS